MAVITRVIELERCGSTNDECMRLAEAGAEHGTAVITAEQTGGRGRRGRRWYSSGRGNLFASIILRPQRPLAELAPISLVAGIAVAEAIRCFSVPAQLKWPNDIVVGKKKIGGILTESVSTRGEQPAAVIGIGVNIVLAPSNAMVDQPTTAMLDEHGDEVSARLLLDSISNCLASPLADFMVGGVPAIRDRWLALWRDRGQRAQVTRARGDVAWGVADGLQVNGALVIKTDTGERLSVVAGDVDIDYA